MTHLFGRGKFLGVLDNLSLQFFLTFILLLVLGLLFLVDVSAPQGLQFFNDRFYFLKQQLISLGVGAFFFVLFFLIDYRVFSRWSSFIFLVSIFLLILLLFPAFGQSFLGARRWLFIGQFGFQPSEFVKFALVVYFASLIEKRKPLISFLIPLCAVVFLIMQQPDLGTSLVIGAVGLGMIFLSGIPLLYFIVMIVLSSLLVLAAILMSSYRRDRFFSFLNQIEDPLGKTYHINQIIISLGLGGVWGLGVGNSRQKYLFLPEAATDSIFAVIAEEVGFVGSLVLILLFFYFFYLGYKIALRTNDPFGKALVFGFLIWIGSQTFINLSSIVALLPITGIPLPFFSYGGSSLISLMMAVALVIKISLNPGRKQLFSREKVLNRKWRRYY